jgi:hypothetical protein
VNTPFCNFFSHLFLSFSFIPRLFLCPPDGVRSKNNEHAVSERFFTLRLKEIGFEQSRTSTERFWVGIGLLE